MDCLVVDCNFLAHRAKHTTSIMSYNGRYTGVIYGFLNQLHKIADLFQPDQYVLAWDSKFSVRKETFPDYKKKPHKELSEEEKELEAESFRQFDMLRPITHNMGFTNNFVQKGIEADDIIADVVMNNDGYNFIVVTADEDLFQLLDYCDIYKPTKEVTLTAEDFREEYGIEPHQWSEVKKIGGCTADKIPGVPGVGEKTAIKFLKNELGEHTKAYESIMNNDALLERNKILVELPHPKTQSVELSPNFTFNYHQFLKICRHFGFMSFRRNIRDWADIFQGS
mgnify:CR=1 FL=1